MRHGQAAAAALSFCVWSMPALALEVGETLTGYAELQGRQVPLPEGEWVVAGLGNNTIVSGVAGAYGTIENAVLLQFNGDKARGIVEINTNTISVTEGWGTTDACLRDGVLAKLNLYRTAVDGFCYFVTETAQPVTGGTDAWKAAKAFTAERGYAMPQEWLTVGFRLSNRHDILDARYHFDGLELGTLAPSMTTWSPETVVTDPDKYAVVNDLNAWAGLTSELFESGLRGRLAEKLHGRSVPQPLAVLETGTIDPSAVGRASKAARKRALQELAAEGVIREDDLASYFAAVDNTAPPPTLENYYQTLVAKMISFNLFRVSVDYLLAYIVTVSAAVSGYITASIVVTHSMAQIANDLAWDSYIAGQRKDGSELVEFDYIERPVETKS
ncbi:hypothetical protein T8K17_07770 [Thalassobaculum sp. OXR-137]|uniref:hypothetical protein n=1 Tax=Thalassobaculum sp. OXR-137 TaxID=3100173 RepID=UPI002AC9E969|nr:hypothetical protein [Thalassobaculum sp. OXR-137]WPZ36030.1 hypothetical protein T8K17_07770 [Thalassobaculum sp. OXR-137]